MKIIDYLKDKIFDIMISFLILLFILLSLLFFEINKTFVICILLIYINGNIIVLIHDFLKRKKFYNHLENKLRELKEKYLITEVLDRPNFIDGNILIDSFYEIDKNYNENINKYKLSHDEFKDYIELWCHEIKTPIATSKLIITNNKNKTTESINEEVNNIEYFVEQMLFYARSETLEKDYIIGNVNLNDIIKEVIKNNKKAILGHNIKIKLFDDEVIVKSDNKWLSFIINQIVNNSIKYSKKENANISFSFKKEKNSIILNIEDNGIGINEFEVNKVFDKGFTGINGRKNYKSTGFGLYLCKKLCSKLGHNIILSSTEGKSTIVTIIFPSNSFTNI